MQFTYAAAQTYNTAKKRTVRLPVDIICVERAHSKNAGFKEP